MFKAVKLLKSFSISGPVSTENPKLANIDIIESIVLLIGWIFPSSSWLPGLIGSVTSKFSFFILLEISISLRSCSLISKAFNIFNLSSSNRYSIKEIISIKK